MSLPPSLPAPILETVLTRLAALFLAGFYAPGLDALVYRKPLASPRIIPH